MDASIDRRAFLRGSALVAGSMLTCTGMVRTASGAVVPRIEAPIVDKLVKHIHAMQDDPEVQKKLATAGLEPLKETPQQFGARMRRDHERFRDIVKAANLQPQ